MVTLRFLEIVIMNPPDISELQLDNTICIYAENNFAFLEASSK